MFSNTVITGEFRHNGNVTRGTLSIYTNLTLYYGTQDHSTLFHGRMYGWEKKNSGRVIYMHENGDLMLWVDGMPYTTEVVGNTARNAYYDLFESLGMTATRTERNKTRENDFSGGMFR